MEEYHVIAYRSSSKYLILCNHRAVTVERPIPQIVNPDVQDPNLPAFRHDAEIERAPKKLGEDRQDME